jgi:hypothetical protein
MKTLPELSRLGGKEWSNSPAETLSTSDRLLWLATNDIAAWMELSLHPLEFFPAAADTVMLLADVVNHFTSIGALPPYAVVHVLLLNDRAIQSMVAPEPPLT